MKHNIISFFLINCQTPIVTFWDGLHVITMEMGLQTILKQSLGQILITQIQRIRIEVFGETARTIMNLLLIVRNVNGWQDWQIAKIGLKEDTSGKFFL